MPNDCRRSRRSFLAISAGAATAAPQVLRAQSPRQVTCLTDWLHQGPNNGFAVAKEKGFYSELGLDVTLNQGKGSGSTAQVVANKASTFGFATSDLSPSQLYTNEFVPTKAEFIPPQNV